MDPVEVAYHVIFLWESFIAHITFVGFLSSVRSHVPLQVFSGCKPSLAMLALVIFYPRLVHKLGFWTYHVTYLCFPRVAHCPSLSLPCVCCPLVGYHLYSVSFPCVCCPLVGSYLFRVTITGEDPSMLSQACRSVQMVLRKYTCNIKPTHL